VTGAVLVVAGLSAGGYALAQASSEPPQPESAASSVAITPAGTTTASDVTVGPVDVAVGGSRIQADGARAEAEGACFDGVVTVDGRSIVEGLTVDGRAVEVTGAADQQVPLAGGVLVVNRHERGDRTLVVTALHASGVGVETPIARTRVEVTCVVGESAGVQEVLPRRKVIATRTQGDLRAVITAVRGPDAAEPIPASVRLAVLRRDGGVWRRAAERAVGRPLGFFAHPVMGPGAVRRLRVQARLRQVSFQLLITPSIGWSSTYRFKLVGGKLVPA
jgi:hypothetical protein